MLRVHSHSLAGSTELECVGDCSTALTAVRRGAECGDERPLMVIGFLSELHPRKNDVIAEN